MTKTTEIETVAVEDAPYTDPTTAGMDALRAAGHEPIKIWGVKGPKGVGGVISAVFLQASSEVVILHQMDGGKFGVFRKGEV